MEMLDRATPPQIHNLGRMTIPPVAERRLDNGVRLVTLNAGEEEVNSISVVLEGGTSDAPQAAIAMLAANGAKEGTAARTSSEIADAYDYNGAWMQPKYEAHYISWTLKSLNSNLLQVLPVFTDMISAPSYPSHECDILIENLASATELEMERERYYARIEIQRLAAGASHPLARVNRPEEIREITADDARAFHARAFNPERLTVYLSGRITPEIEQAAAAAFAALRPVGPGIISPIAPYKPTTGVTVEIPRPGALQSAVAFTLPAIPREDPDYITLRAAVMGLGGYFGSRLMTNIREDKGYTYGITAHLLGSLDGSNILIETETDNKHVAALIDETRREVASMSTRPMTGDELQRLKRNYLSELAGQLSTPFAMMSTYQHQQLTGTPPDYFERQQDVLDRLTPDEIMSVSAKYLNPDLLSIAIAGDM